MKQTIEEYFKLRKTKKIQQNPKREVDIKDQGAFTSRGKTRDCGCCCFGMNGNQSSALIDGNVEILYTVQSKRARFRLRRYKNVSFFTIVSGERETVKCNLSSA